MDHLLWTRLGWTHRLGTACSFLPPTCTTHWVSIYGWSYLQLWFYVEGKKCSVANCHIKIFPKSQGSQWPALGVQVSACGVLEGTVMATFHFLLSCPNFSGPNDRRSHTAPPTFKDYAMDENPSMEVTSEPSQLWVPLEGPKLVPTKL